MNQINAEQSLPCGILGKTQIEGLMDSTRNLIEHGDKERLQPCSYDLRIGTIYKNGEMIEDQKPVDIEPGEIISMHSMEVLHMPEDIAGTVFPINSQSSEGFMVLNPGHIDPGYIGPITIKAINLRKSPLSIMKGDPIFTVIFEKMPVKTTGYDNKFSINEKKRNQLKKDRDVSPDNLFEIANYTKKFPYTTKDDVKNTIVSHWMSWVTMSLSIIAVLIGVTSLILASTTLIAMNKTSRPIAETVQVAGSESTTKQKELESRASTANPIEENSTIHEDSNNTQ